MGTLVIVTVDDIIVGLYLFRSVVVIAVINSSNSMYDRMQRLTTMVYSSLSRLSSSCSVPVTCPSQCLPVTCVHHKPLKRCISDTRAPSFSGCFIPRSYKQHFVRQFHVSCSQETSSSRHGQPDEQLVNISFIASYCFP